MNTHNLFVCDKALEKRHIHNAMKHTKRHVTNDRVLTLWINEISLTMKRFLRCNFIAKHKYKERSTLFFRFHWKIKCFVLHKNYNKSEWQHSKESMCHLRNIACDYQEKCDYQKSVTDRQKDARYIGSYVSLLRRQRTECTSILK